MVLINVTVILAENIDLVNTEENVKVKHPKVTVYLFYYYFNYY